ncbi:MAG: DNA replication and repair protein RecF [Eggerthellaceae bacterium]|nr:DNA replication and repair protein RecF [Eggerthellaceae bacterium]
MSLTIKDLSFFHFRNYDSFHLEMVSPITVLIGENAVGKTNIIEGIELLTSLSSFRHASLQQLIKEKEEQSKLCAHIKDDQRDLVIDLVISEDRKSYFLNGKKKHSSDLKGLIPSVIFTPDDLALVKGAQSIRRSEFDRLGSQLSKNYGIIKRDCENVLRHKNKLLKENPNDTLLDAIDEMLVTCGAQLTCYRSAFLMRFASFINEYYSQLSSSRESLTMGFTPSWEEKPNTGPIERYDPSYARNEIQKALNEHRGEEKKRQRCLVGPHLDTIHYYLNGKDATLYGSQGQQRSIVLAYRMAELALIEELLHQRPILLLDDVMSELDAKRRKELMRFIPEETQVFITTTTLAYFDDLSTEKIQPVYLPLS